MRMWTKHFDKKFDPNAPEMPPFQGRYVLKEVDDVSLMFSGMFEMVKGSSKKPHRPLDSFSIDSLI